MRDIPLKRIAFCRRYSSYTGGHRKVRDYIDHFLALGWQPSLYLLQSDDGLPPLFNDIEGVEYQSQYDPSDAELVFLAGMDWQDYSQYLSLNKPIINLIQHVRHGDINQPLFSFLQHKAHRICVSKAVHDAIAPHANGPVCTISNGHKLYSETGASDNLLYILGTKQPSLANKIANRAKAKGLSLIVDTEPTSPSQVRNNMARSRVTLALPHETEGFYLPGIEAMYYSRVAVVPDCVANVEYCRKGANILTCELSEEAIWNAIMLALASDKKLFWSYRHFKGKRRALSYSLTKERQKLANLLSKLPVDGE